MESPVPLHSPGTRGYGKGEELAMENSHNSSLVPRPSCLVPRASSLVPRWPLAWGERTYIMGIINVTPDSFSRDGLHTDVEAAVAQGRRFVAAGADMLDVGGESTRPGAAPVDEASEVARVTPVVEALARAVEVPLSVDTSKAGVAEAALRAGATVVNDVTRLSGDAGMAGVVARAGA